MSAPFTRPVWSVETSDLRDIAQKRYDDFVDALREMVNVDCGSYTPDGVNVIADLCQARFERWLGRRADAARARRGAGAAR